MIIALWILAILSRADSQSCTSLPDSLDGVWTSTNLGTITISSSARTLSMTKLFSTQTAAANYFDCEFNSGTQYVFKSNTTVSSFSGNYIVYGCFDFRYSSDDVYYYYLNSDVEPGLGGLRMKGFVSPITSLSQACETTLDTAEFNTMVKTGFESRAISANNCPTPLLSSSIFTYTDNSGTYCNGDNSTISTCSDPKYHTLFVNKTTCSSQPVIPIMFSTNGSLGCLVTVENTATSVTYISLYNLDSSIISTTSQFTCAAMQQDSNNTIHMSIFPTDCISAQSPTVLPSVTSGTSTTYGATLELTPTGIPPTGSSGTTYLWLIVLLLLLAALIVIIIIIICLHKQCKTREVKIAREKPILAAEEHPLGEMSIVLDAPPSLARVPNGYIDMENEVFKTPRSLKKKGDMMNPIGETSMNLSFAGKSWSKLTPRKSIVEAPSDPFTEMDSGVVVLSPEGSRAPHRTKTPSKHRFDGSKTPRPLTNGSAREPLAITDGRDPYPPVTPDPWESKTARSERSIKSFLARSVYAPSVRAPSVKAMSTKAPSVKAQSVKAPSVKAAPIVKAAPSVRAPSLSARSVKANSTKASSIKGQPVTDRTVAVRPKHKLARSYTSTKIGSVTRRAAPASPRKKPMDRSKTMVVHSERSDGMAEFMNAEMSNWGDASELGRSVKTKKSARTARSRASHATNRSTASPRKSILKRKSRYFSSKEFMTEEEIIKRIAAGESTPIVGSSAPSAGSANGSRNLQDEYNDMIERSNPLSGLKKVRSSKKPWH
ncbi:hypothetical protein ACF0H5_021356 [Mactra antiquata]